MDTDTELCTTFNDYPELHNDYTTTILNCTTTTQRLQLLQRLPSTAQRPHNDNNYYNDYTELHNDYTATTTTTTTTLNCTTTTQRLH